MNGVDVQLTDDEGRGNRVEVQVAPAETADAGHGERAPAARAAVAARAGRLVAEVAALAGVTAALKKAGRKSPFWLPGANPGCRM